MSRVVLVTGGNRGIGLACATAFARQGDSVAVTCRGEVPPAVTDAGLSRFTICAASGTTTNRAALIWLAIVRALLWVWRFFPPML